MSPFKGKGLRKKNFEFETNYIIDGFLVERAITLIFAPPKHGKSRFANGLSKWLFQNTHFHVQYFDFDNSLSALKDRGVDELIEEGVGKFDYIHPEEVTITSREALDKLVENAQGNNYAGYVLIFDSATDFCDESNDNSVKVFMNKLKALRNAGATPIILHHTNKKDPSYKGSTVFRSASDNVYALINEYEDESGTTYLLNKDAARFQVKDCAFKLSSDDYELEALDYADVCIPATERVDIRKVVSTLQQNKEPMKQGALLQEALETISSNKTAVAFLDKYDGKHWRSEKQGKFKIYALI